MWPWVPQKVGVEWVATFQGRTYMFSKKPATPIVRCKDCGLKQVFKDLHYCHGDESGWTDPINFTRTDEDINWDDERLEYHRYQWIPSVRVLHRKGTGPFHFADPHTVAQGFCDHCGDMLRRGCMYRMGVWRGPRDDNGDPIYPSEEAESEEADSEEAESLVESANEQFCTRALVLFRTK